MPRIHSSFAVVLLSTLSALGCAAPERHSEDFVESDQVDSLSVDVGSGDVWLRGADVAEVSVHARIEGDRNHLGHAFTAGTLTLVDDCHDSRCSVDIDATLPAGVPVTVHTGSGDLVLEDLLGTVTLRTGSGDIQGDHVAGANLDIEAGSGDLALSVAEPAEHIRATTHSGDVRLSVPSGAYRLDVNTDSGDRHIDGITNDPSAPATLDVSTNSGDIRVNGY
jgi:hypothetical protein